MTFENFKYWKTDYHYLVTNLELRFVKDFVLKGSFDIAP